MQTNEIKCPHCNYKALVDSVPETDLIQKILKSCDLKLKCI